MLPFPDVPVASGVPLLLGQIGSAAAGVGRLTSLAGGLVQQVHGLTSAVLGLPALAAGIPASLTSIAVSMGSTPGCTPSQIAQVNGMAITVAGAFSGVPGISVSLGGLSASISGFPSFVSAALGAPAAIVQTASSMLGVANSVIHSIGTIGSTLTGVVSNIGTLSTQMVNIGATAISGALNSVGTAITGVVNSIFPGVPSAVTLLTPALSNFTGGGIATGSLFNTGGGLLGADSTKIASSNTAAKWGIFTKDGQPVLTGDSTISVDWRTEYRISDYPVEQGGFGSYNKVASPFDFRLTFACMGAGGSVGSKISRPSSASRTAFLLAVEQAAKSLDLYTCVTPERSYPSCSITHADYRREARAGVTLLKVDVWLEEVRETATAAFTATKTPEAADATEKGDVQIKTPTTKELAGASAPAATGDSGLIGQSTLPVGPVQDAPFTANLTPPGKDINTSFSGSTANPALPGSVNDTGQPIPVLPILPPPLISFTGIPGPNAGDMASSSAAHTMGLQ